MEVLNTSPDVEDILSSLPEEIISRILSRMPTTYAVRTSILSKRWRNSWTLVTNLHFDDFRINPNPDIDGLTKFVDRVLKYCKTSQVKSFRLQLLSKGHHIQKSSVTSWIDKAVALSVCELDVGVVEVNLPPSFFTCKTLTKLKLQNFLSCPSSVNLPSLKTLDIVVYKKPLDNAYKLIRGCPMLESLSFKVKLCYYHEGDYIFNIPTLKRLELVVESLSANNQFINKAVLNVPNLKYLNFRGTLSSLFVMEDLLWLVEASVSTCYVAYDYLLVELLKGVSRVKSLSTMISTKNIPSTLLLPVFPNMQRLNLKVIWQFGLISRFLESCPELKHLCIESGHEMSFEELEESSWIEPKSVPSCMLTNLTTIKFSNCTGQMPEMQFLEYMLQKAKVLKTVAITWENVCTEELKRLCEQLLAVPKASWNCEICFVK